MDWKEWRTHPATVAWFRALEREEIAGVQQHLGEGGTLKATVDETALETAKLVGIREGLRRARDFKPGEEE